MIYFSKNWGMFGWIWVYWRQNWKRCVQLVQKMNWKLLFWFVPLFLWKNILSFPLPIIFQIIPRITLTNMNHSISISNNWIWKSILGRHRWVEYASKNRYNASQVPPEWHGWLHYITDHTGDEVSFGLWI